LEFNVPFQHKYGYIRDEEILRRCSILGELGCKRRRSNGIVRRCDKLHTLCRRYRQLPRRAPVWHRPLPTCLSPTDAVNHPVDSVNCLAPKL